MIKLQGFARSNYTNLIHAYLIEGGVEFELVQVSPSQEEDFLAKSLMRKVPAIETDEGFISETLAIVSYIEAAHPDKPLLPADPFSRAKTVELICHIKLDVELEARRCLPAAFFGATASEEKQKSTQKAVAKGLKAANRLIVCDPYATGSEFNLADLYVYYSFGLAGGISQALWQTDILSEYPNIQGLMALLSERDSIKQVAAAT